MMQLHLDEISRNVAVGAHAVLLLDRAGWHTTGKLGACLDNSGLWWRRLLELDFVCL